MNQPINNKTFPNISDQQYNNLLRNHADLTLENPIYSKYITTTRPINHQNITSIILHHHYKDLKKKLSSHSVQRQHVQPIYGMSCASASINNSRIQYRSIVCTQICILNIYFIYMNLSTKSDIDNCEHFMCWNKFVQTK